MLITLIISISFLFSQGISQYSNMTSESSSLAGSIVSSKGGTWSLFSNPSTIVEVENNSISIGYSNLYNQKYLPLSSIGLIISKYSMNFGIKYSSLQVEYQNIELLKNEEIGLVTGFDLIRDKNSSLSIGVSANFLMINFGPSAGVTGDGTYGVSSTKLTSFGLDLGLLAVLRDKNRLGVLIKNINSPSIGRGVSNQNLPRLIDLGLSTMPSKNLIVTFSLEQLLGNQDTQFKTSFKYQISDSIHLNTGLQMNPNRFGFGFNIDKEVILLSYGILTHHVLPETHHFNIGIKF